MEKRILEKKREANADRSLFKCLGHMSLVRVYENTGEWRKQADEQSREVVNYYSTFSIKIGYEIKMKFIPKSSCVTKPRNVGYWDHSYDPIRSDSTPLD